MGTPDFAEMLHERKAKRLGRETSGRSSASRILRRYWPNIPVGLTDEAIRYIEGLSATVVNPMSDAERASGSYTHVSAKMERLPDGRSVLVQTLRLSSDIVSFTSEQSLTGSRATIQRHIQTDPTMNAVTNTQSVISVRRADRREDDRYDLVEEQITSYPITSGAVTTGRSKTYTETTTVSDNQTSVGSIASLASRGTEYSKTFQILKDGTYAVVDKTKTAVPLDLTGITNATGDAITTGNACAWSETTQISRGVTSVTVPTEALQHIKRLGVELQADGSLVVRTEDRTSKDQTSNGSTQANGYTSVVVNHTASNTEAEVAAGTVNVGNTVTVVNERNDDGTIRSRHETRTSVNQASNSAVNAAGYTVAIEEQTAALTEINAEGQNVGVVVTARNDKKDDGTIRTAKETRTAVDQQSNSHVNAAGYTIVTETHTASTEEATNVGQATGTIVTTRNDRNDDGTIRSSKDTKTAVDQTAYSNTQANGYTITVETHTACNAEATVGTVGLGHIIQVGNRPNDDGTYASSKEDRLAILQTSQSYVQTCAYSVVTSTTLASNAADTNISAANVGITVSIDNNVRPDGWFDIIKKTTTTAEINTGVINVPLWGGNISVVNTHTVAYYGIPKANVQAAVTDFAQNTASNTDAVQYHLMGMQPDGTMDFVLRAVPDIAKTDDVTYDSGDFTFEDFELGTVYVYWRVSTNIGWALDLLDDATAGHTVIGGAGGHSSNWRWIGDKKIYSERVEIVTA